jgi:hypothetical protein
MLRPILDEKPRSAPPGFAKVALGGLERPIVMCCHERPQTCSIITSLFERRVGKDVYAIGQQERQKRDCKSLRRGSLPGEASS